MANYKGSSRIPPERYAESGNAMLTRGLEAAERCVEDHPASSVGIAFGTGLGIGLCVGLALRAALQERRETRRSMTERLGRQVLDALTSVIPESLSNRISR
jgi:hypothetical protein